MLSVTSLLCLEVGNTHITIRRRLKISMGT